MTNTFPRDFGCALLYVPVEPDGKTCSRRLESVEMWKSWDRMNRPTWRQEKGGGGSSGPWISTFPRIRAAYYWSFRQVLQVYIEGRTQSPVEAHPKSRAVPRKGAPKVPWIIPISHRSYPQPTGSELPFHRPTCKRYLQVAAPRTPLAPRERRKRAVAIRLWRPLGGIVPAR